MEDGGVGGVGGPCETVCRTTAIETSMKSSAFGFLLASLHFPDYLVRVPSAVSVVWMAVLGSSMAGGAGCVSILPSIRTNPV